MMRVHLLKIALDYYAALKDNNIPSSLHIGKMAVMGMGLQEIEEQSNLGQKLFKKLVNLEV